MINDARAKKLDLFKQILAEGDVEKMIKANDELEKIHQDWK